MAINPTSSPTLPDGPQRSGRNALLPSIAGGAVLAAAITAAVLVARSDSRETALQPLTLVPPSGNASVGPASEAEVPATLYIVRSDEQAACVQRDISDAEGIRIDAGRLSHTEMALVVVVPGDAEGNPVVRAWNEDNRARADVGVAENRVVDLRGK